MRTIGPLKFWWTDDDEMELWRPTRCWIESPLEQFRQMDHWHLSFSMPADPTRRLEVTDLKRWLLFEPDGKRWLGHAGPNQESYRRQITPDLVLKRYIRSLVDTLPDEVTDWPMSVLIPALSDEVYARYRDAIRAELPDAVLLSEPEMVLEYFRLVTGELVLDPSRNNVVLVIDLGASTTNLSIVVTNKRGQVVGGTADRARAARLRPIPGVAAPMAGRWVDEQLAMRMLGTNSDGANADRLMDVLDDVERLKIRASLLRRPQRLGALSMTLELLQDVATELTNSLESPLAEMSTRLWEQQHATDDTTAQRAFARVCEERAIDGPDTALRLIDTVIVAGGTGRLYGLRGALEGLLALHPDVAWLDVGDGFETAAAVGALAHVLYQRSDPPRLVFGGERSKPQEFRSTLGSDIVLGWKLGRQREQQILAVDGNDPILYTGGEKCEVGAIPIETGDKVKARLYPVQLEKFERKGIKMPRLTASAPHPVFDVVVEPDKGIRLRSANLSGLGDVRISLDKFGIRGELPDTGLPEVVPAGSAYLYPTDALVIDLGMSKTVVVSSVGGVLDPTTLERRSGVRESGSTALTNTEFGRPESPTNGEDGGSSGEVALDHGNAAAANAIGAQRPASRSKPEEQSERESALRPAPSTLDRAPGTSELRAMGAPTAQPEREVDNAPRTPAAEQSLDESGAGGTANTGHRRSVDKSSSRRFQRAVRATPAEDPVSGGSVGVDWARGSRVSPSDFVADLERYLSSAVSAGESLPKGDFVYTLLALAVRPFLMLAGPPGCGKSTLARMVARALGKNDGDTLIEIPVQACWTRTGDLPSSARLERLIEPTAPPRLLLFDEFNLTRPEYYLAQHFNHLDRVEDPRWRAIGTLNIDETSRPPSPKVVDRCFLLEVSAHRGTETVARNVGAPAEVEPLSGLPRVDELGAVEPHESVVAVTAALEKVAEEHLLREDLLPSRRTLSDVRTMMELHGAMGDAGAALISCADLVDRLIASRLLVKLYGVADQVEPAINAVWAQVKDTDELRRTKRRVSIARKQLSLGFVSPWQ